MQMRMALKAAMLVIGILFLALTLYMYGQVSAAMRPSATEQLARAVGAAGGYIGSASLAGLCFIAYAVLRHERAPKE